MTQPLDEALANYLSLIDNYISLVSVLCETLKKGYFSIAKANYINLYKPGYLAVQENYDKRMKAIYRVNISNQDVRLIELKRVVSSKELSSLKVEKIPTNPLYWFGILVPQELRNAQMHFKDGLEKIINIVNLSFVLENLEKQILTYRKQLYSENN